VTKTCTGCLAEKPIEMFYRKARSRDGYATRCKECHNAKVKEWEKSHPENIRARTYRWRERNPEKARAIQRRSEMKRKYGLTEDQFVALLASQDGKCAICRTDDFGGRWDALCVDHDHSCCSSTRGCGKCVRGLLCGNCNSILGLAQDNASRLRAAIEYLEAHHGQLARR